MSDNNHPQDWTRRQFMTGFVLPAAGLVITGLSACGQDRKKTGPDKRVSTGLSVDLVVAKDGEPAALVQKAIAELGGMTRFVSRGDVVVLKPNIGFNRAPEQAANTNPDVVRELAIQVLNAGASRVVIFDHSLYEARHCYSRSGISQRVQDLGVELEYTEERKFVDLAIDGAWLKHWPVYRQVLECDKLINIPIAKQHSTARLSLGFKNLMGVIGGKRESFHQNIHQALVDLSAKIRPTLTVLDAYRVLLRNGPQGGSLSDVLTARTLAASPDPVAIDAFGCSLFNLEPGQMPHLQDAQARGLGRMNLSELRLRTVVA